MKTAAEFLNSKLIVSDYRPTWEEVHSMLQKYAKIVIEECANTAKVTVIRTHSMGDIYNVNKDTILKIKENL